MFILAIKTKPFTSITDLQLVISLRTVSQLNRHLILNLNRAMSGQTGNVRNLNRTFKSECNFLKKSPEFNKKCFHFIDKSIVHLVLRVINFSIIFLVNIIDLIDVFMMQILKTKIV